MPSRIALATLAVAAVVCALPARALDTPERSARSSGVTLSALVMAHDVEDGEPVWADVPFIDDGERIYVFLIASNRAEQPRRLAIEIGSAGRVERRRQVAIPAGAREHRSWAFLASGLPSGEWSTTVRTADGEPLGRVDFEVEGRVEPGCAAHPRPVRRTPVRQLSPRPCLRSLSWSVVRLTPRDLAASDRLPRACCRAATRTPFS